MLGRVPDTGTQPRDRQGPKTALTLSTIEAIRAAHRAGAQIHVLAAEHRVTARTIYRYLAPDEDPVRDVVRGIVADANRTYDLGMSRNQLTDVADEITRMVRQRGWLA